MQIPDKSVLNIFNKLPQNLVRVFWGKRLYWHALALALTYISVTSGFDWQYYQAVQIPSLRFIVWPGAIIGFLVPVLLPLTLLIIGSIKKNLIILNTAFAIGQAAFLGWFVSALYKIFTGRPGPINAITDITHIFKFGFFRGGIFWGWPSSHTTVAFAMALALFTMYPNKKPVRIWSVVYALYIGISVSMTIHWFSDFIAGAIFGSIVGIVAGKSFLNKLARALAPKTFE